MAIVHGRDDLPEEMASITLTQTLSLTDVIVQVAPAGILHDNHNLAAVLKHWGRGRQMDVKAGSSPEPGGSSQTLAPLQIAC